MVGLKWMFKQEVQGAQLAETFAALDVEFGVPV